MIYTVVQPPEFAYDFTVTMKYWFDRSGVMHILELTRHKPQMLS